MEQNVCFFIGWKYVSFVPGYGTIETIYHGLFFGLQSLKYLTLIKIDYWIR